MAKKSSWYSGWDDYDYGYGGGYYGDDWFGRTDRHHVTTHKTGPRLGWDWGRSNSYSSFFAPDLNKQKLIKDSFRHIADIRDILGVPKKVSIKLHGDESSYTDGNSVTISTKVFDDEVLESNQKLDIFLGTGIHEFAHILHTDMEAVKRVPDAHGRDIEPDSMEFQVFNMVEDERIESKITEVYPGYATFLGQSKYYYYDLLFDEYPGDDVTDVCTAILHLIRYPSKLNKKVYERHKILFEKIREVLSSLGENSEDAAKKAVEIWKLIVEYFKLPPPPPKEKKKGDEGSEGEGDGEEGKTPKSGSDEGSAGKPIKSASEEQIREKLKELVKKMMVLSDATGNQISQEIGDNEIKGKMFTDEYKDLGKKVFKNKADDKPSTYKEDREKIKHNISFLVNTFNKFFVEQEFALTGMRRGKLDTNKIAEAYQNVETVYKKNFKRITPGLDVCILIDESGSMSGRKIDKARQCAILLNEVCKKVPKCNFYIYGHTADRPSSGDTLINVYKDKWNQREHSLGSVKAHANNRDHVAIEQVHKMVREQTNAPLLMFVISDGAPAAHGMGSNGEELVKKVVNKIESKGDTLICQVAIEAYNEPETMFNHYVKMTDMTSFPTDLSKYIMHTLISKLKRIDV